VEAHPVELEGEAAAHLGNGDCAALVSDALIHPDSREEQIHILHIALVEGEMHFDLLLRNALECRESKGLCGVGHRNILYHC